MSNEFTRMTHIFTIVKLTESPQIAFSLQNLMKLINRTPPYIHILKSDISTSLSPGDTNSSLGMEGTIFFSAAWFWTFCYIFNFN